MDQGLAYDTKLEKRGEAAEESIQVLNHRIVEIDSNRVTGGTAENGSSAAERRSSRADESTSGRANLEWGDALLQRPIPAEQRNYVQYFALDVGGLEGHDHYIYRHANGLCVVGMAPGHAALRAGKLITAVDFDVGKKNKQHVEVTGKNKKNAKLMEPMSSLCKVVLADGAFFIMRCCMKASLLEVNYRLAEDMSLLADKAASEGFVAILMPRPAEWAKAAGGFLDREQYRARRGLL